MEKKVLIEALKSTSFSFPLEEIRNIMDEELAKDPAEMDADLVDLCMDILEEGYARQEQPVKNKKRIKLKRVLLAAAVITVIIAIAVPVCAAFTHNEVSDKIVRFYSDYFYINLRQGSTNASHYSDEDIDLIQELQERGFSDVILPSDLLNYDYSKDIFIQEGDNYTSATITIEDTESKICGSIGITQYDKIIESTGEENVSKNFNHVEQISINGLDIIVFGNDKDSYIKYFNNNMEYSISLSSCDFNTAVEIANSIK